MKRENEYTIFGGSVTKSVKMMGKKAIRIIISFYINKLKDIAIGIKLAMIIKGIMPFVYVDTLHQKMRGIGMLKQGKTIRIEEKWGYMI